jgi:hypothetical protein
MTTPAVDPTEYRLQLVKQMLDAAAEELAELLCDLKRVGREAAAQRPDEPKEGTP